MKQTKCENSQILINRNFSFISKVKLIRKSIIITENISETKNSFFLAEYA
jgi:hypothetical protein